MSSAVWRRPQRRVLVFVQPATGTAHTFRRRNDGTKHYVRAGHSTGRGAWVRHHRDRIGALPSQALVQLAEAIGSGGSGEVLEVARPLVVDLLTRAARGRLEERELRRIAVAMSRARDDEGALTLVERQLLEHPEWQDNPSPASASR